MRKDHLRKQVEYLELQLKIQKVNNGLLLAAFAMAVLMIVVISIN